MKQVTISMTIQLFLTSLISARESLSGQQHMICYQQEKAERLKRLRQKVCIEKTTMEAPNWKEGGSGVRSSRLKPWQQGKNG
jgi:hypothetical protein